jgi:hypothetical protein
MEKDLSFEMEMKKKKRRKEKGMKMCKEEKKGIERKENREGWEDEVGYFWLHSKLSLS